MIKKNITIKDIARLAGVSPGTVDRVLHNRGRVAEDSMLKVMKVLGEFDYKPNLMARSLASNNKYRIAALIPDPNLDPYWEESNEGILQAQLEWAYYGITIEPYLFDLYNKDSFKDKAQDALLTQPDGVVTAPIFYDEALRLFDQLDISNIPYVLFNTNIPEAKSVSFIGQDLYHSGQLGAELMYLGQHLGGKLAVLHIDEDIHNSLHLVEKERGFREYFKDKNKITFEINEFSLNPKASTFKAQFNSLLNDSQLRGIFVSTSKGTSVAASLLEKHGKKDIRLIGYDMLDDSLEYLRSGTIDFLINQNPKRQASLSISHLVNHIMFKKKAPDLDLFPLEIITQQNLESYLASEIH